MSGDNRNPVTCGYGIGFDGVYVCRLELKPCPAVKTCPLMVDHRPLADAFDRVRRERKK